MAPQALIEYLNQVQSQGISIDSVIPELTAAGWTEEQISAARTAVAPTPTAAPSLQPTPAQPTQSITQSTQAEPAAVVTQVDAAASTPTFTIVMYSFIGVLLVSAIALGLYFFGFSDSDTDAEVVPVVTAE